MSTFPFKPALMPVPINYSSGEQASPLKLQYAFQSVQHAFSVLQNYLGNGRDYDNSSNSLYHINNIPIAIGDMSEVYFPLNLFGSLRYIYNSYGNSKDGNETGNRYFKYNKTGDKAYLQTQIVNDYIYIPFPKGGVQQTEGVGYVFGIIYNNSENVEGITIDFLAQNSDYPLSLNNDGTIPSGVKYTSVTLSPSIDDYVLSHGYIYIPAITYEISTLRIKISNSESSDISQNFLRIYSLYLVDTVRVDQGSYLKPEYGVSSNAITIVTNDLEAETTINYAPVNISYVAGSCTIGKNCSHIEDCIYRISDSACIGNTFDIFSPLIVGQSSVSLASKTGAVVCKNSGSFSYETTSGAGIVCQSNLNISDNMFGIKFLPFYLSSEKSSLYCKSSGILNASHTDIKTKVFDLSFLSTINNLRRVLNQLSIVDTNSYLNVELIPNSSSVTIIGGDFSISKVASQFFNMLSHGLLSQISTYAD